MNFKRRLLSSVMRYWLRSKYAKFGLAYFLTGFALQFSLLIQHIVWGVLNPFTVALAIGFTAALLVSIVGWRRQLRTIFRIVTNKVAADILCFRLDMASESNDIICSIKPCPVCRTRQAVNYLSNDRCWLCNYELSQPNLSPNLENLMGLVFGTVVITNALAYIQRDVSDGGQGQA